MIVLELKLVDSPPCILLAVSICIPYSTSSAVGSVAVASKTGVAGPKAVASVVLGTIVGGLLKSLVTLIVGVTL